MVTNRDVYSSATSLNRHNDVEKVGRLMLYLYQSRVGLRPEYTQELAGKVQYY
jgi:hypothetical protein